MANYNYGIDLPFTASGDMNANQYKFVRGASTAGRIQLANGASGPMPIGVLQNDPRNLEGAQVRVLGSTKVWFSGSAAVGNNDFLSSGSGGQAELTSGSRAVQGYSVEDVAAGCAYINMILFPVTTDITDQTP